MDININLKTIYIKANNIKDYTFIHFDSRFHLEQFIKINNKLLFGHKCCDGKGIKINHISNEELKSLKDTFLKNINNNFHKKNIGECSICYENKLIKNTICNHQFCYECLGSWLKIKKECPMCRAYLNIL
ncbi:hypothetical protein N9O88_01620 [bacterium]|nr:hypothetical protein [bacterium]